MLNIEDTLCSVGNDKQIHFLDLSTGTEALPPHNVGCALFDVLPVPSFDWQFDSGRRSPSAVPGPGDGLLFTPPSACVITSGGDNRLYGWDLSNVLFDPSSPASTTSSTSSLFSPTTTPSSMSSLVSRRGVYEGHSRCTTQLAFLPDNSPSSYISPTATPSSSQLPDSAGGHGHVISGSRDMTLRVWSIRSSQCVSQLQGHSNFVSCVSSLGTTLWSDRVASGSVDMTCRVWDVREGCCVRELRCHERAVRDLAHCEVRSALFCASWDKTLSVTDLRSFNCEMKLWHGDLLYALLWNENEENLILSGTTKGEIWIHDLRSPSSPLGIFKAHPNRIFALEPIASGLAVGNKLKQQHHHHHARIRFASTSDDNTVRVFSISDTQLSLLHYTMSATRHSHSTPQIVAREIGDEAEEHVRGRGGGRERRRELSGIAIPREVCRFETEKNQFGIGYLGPMSISHVSNGRFDRNLPSRFRKVLLRWIDLEHEDDEEEEEVEEEGERVMRNEDDEEFKLTKGLSVLFRFANGMEFRVPRSVVLLSSSSSDIPEVINVESLSSSSIPSLFPDHYDSQLFDRLLSDVSEEPFQNLLLGSLSPEFLACPIPYFLIAVRLNLFSLALALCRQIESLPASRSVLMIAQQCLELFEAGYSMPLSSSSSSSSSRQRHLLPRTSTPGWIPRCPLSLAVLRAIQRNRKTLQLSPLLERGAIEFGVLPAVDLMDGTISLSQHSFFFSIDSTVSDDSLFPLSDWHFSIRKQLLSQCRFHHPSASKPNTIILRTESNDKDFFRAHLDVLVSRSEFFNRMLIFPGRELEHLRLTGEVVVQFFDSAELGALLDFIYVGELPSSFFSFPSILRLLGHCFMYSEQELLQSCLERLCSITRRLRSSGRLESTLREHAHLLAEPNVDTVAYPLIAAELPTLTRSELEVMMDRSSRDHADSELRDYRENVEGRLGALEERMGGVEDQLKELRMLVEGLVKSSRISQE